MGPSAKSQVGTRLLFGQLRRLAPLAFLLALVACGSVLGIEDLHEGPAPGSGGGTGSGGSTASGGAIGTAGDLAEPNGGTAALPAGGSAGQGQALGGASSGGKGGAVSTTTGGSPGAGGNTTLGDGGAGIGAAGESSVGTAVHGRVIDFWGHNVVGVPVQIGAALVTTDAQGQFTIDPVAAEYDVSLVVDFGDSSRETYGWVYQGLTRRDPTLQLYAGIARRSGNIVITPSNVTLNATRTLSVAVAGPDGADQFTGVEANGIQTTTNWRGPATTQERAHGLLWQFDATSTLPTSYIGYDSALAALSDTSDQTMIALNLSATAPIPSGNVGGTITPATNTARENDLFLRFTSGATITLASDGTGPNTFSYLVPTIANGSVTLAAVEGNADFGQYAVAHKDGLAAGTTSITATIPTPSKPLTPIDGATNIDTSSQFTFLAGAGSAGAFVVSMIDEQVYEGLFVVTANKTFKVPVVAGGAYAFGSTHKFLWRVETHGALATVDAMAGPSGFMDEFSGDDASPIGPRIGDGSFTISEANEFTAK